jgi:hypothetical protein
MKHYASAAGDMVRALGTLKPRDEDTRRAIAGSLGFELDDAVQDLPDEPDTRDGPSPSPIPDPLPTPVTPQERDFNLLPQDAQHWSAAAQPPTAASVAPLPRGPAEDTLPRPPFEPLLRRAGERAVVSTMLRTRSRTGPPLISELVLAALQMRPLRNLPASWQESVNGADVLLDVGDNMAVFGRDQEWLLSLIRRVVGEAWLKVFCFSGSPSRGVAPEGEFATGIYQPSRPGLPILMLTDLGIGMQQSADEAVDVSEWQEFARRMRTAGCHLMALVPYPRHRRPKIPQGSVDIIQWDRLTSVRSVRSVLGRARGV